MKNISLSVVLLLIGMVCTASGQTTKWVDQAAGSNQNDGDTELTPYLTLQHAINNTSSGTPLVQSVINVKDGDYGIPGGASCELYSVSILLKDLDYLTIRAAPGHEPVVSSWSAREGFIVSMAVANCNNLVIENIDSDQSDGQFDHYHICGCDNITIRDCTFVGGEDGLDFGNTMDGALIEGNSFVGMNDGTHDGALDFSDGSYSNIVIQDNYFENSNNHITIAPPMGETASNITIQRNTFAQTVSREALQLATATDVTVVNNVFFNSRKQGITVAADCSFINLIHNTFFRNDLGGAGLGDILVEATGTPDIIIQNNIFHAEHHVALESSLVLPLVGQNYNLIYQVAIPANPMDFGPNTLFGDPLFTSTTYRFEDLDIDVLSPAIESGVDLGIMDELGGGIRPVPFGTAPDIGAFEAGRGCVCGNCDLDPAENINVLDAFTAARIASGLLVASGLQLQCCDVDGMPGVGISDALLLAQLSSGASVTLMCP